MLKLNLKNAALAALLTAGLAGSATLTAPAAYAQGYTDRDYRNHDDWRSHRIVYHRYHPSNYHRDWIGIGRPGDGVGIYTNRYHHYCSHWDATYGYCYF